MHSTIAIADFPSRQLINSNDLDDLLLGEVIRKFVFDDPVVQAARSDLATYNRTKRQLAAFSGLFERGFYLWPLNLTAGGLDDLFRPAVCQDEEWSKERWVKAYGPLSREIEMAFEHIATLFAAMMGAFRSNRTAVVDMDNNTVHTSLWRRPNITIELTTSDLYEIGMEQWRRLDNPGGSLLRRGLRLLLPAGPSEVVGGDVPKAKPHRNPRIGKRAGRNKVSTVNHDSIRQAINGIWGKKGPRGILVEQRDRLISDYQRGHGLSVTSDKTNQRFFKK